MDALGCNVDKKHLLDILALLLWGENTTLEVTPFDSRFMKRLYKEILADLKSQIAYRHNAPNDYEALNIKCRDLSDLYFLEKRLELIEERFVESR